MPPQNNASQSGAVRLLKGAAFVFAALGLGTAGWGIDKWLEVPGVRASQFGFQAPLWPAFTTFVLLATAVIVWLLWTAARRVETGEDLFAQRHRRRPQNGEHPDEMNAS